MNIPVILMSTFSKIEFNNQLGDSYLKNIKTLYYNFLISQIVFNKIISHIIILTRKLEELLITRYYKKPRNQNIPENMIDNSQYSNK